jgi:SpoVK/Ycf46/Vps4 family AAA+-type ATPase
MLARGLTKSLRNQLLTGKDEKTRTRNRSIAMFAGQGSSLKGKFVGRTEKNIKGYFVSAQQRAEAYSLPTDKTIKPPAYTSAKQLVAAKLLNKTPEVFRDDGSQISEPNVAEALNDGVIADPGGNAMSILFLDEIYAVAGDRKGPNATPLDKASVNEFLGLLDGVEGFPKVFTIAATNEPWALDSAILSRFKLQLFADVPDTQAREKKILIDFCAHLNVRANVFPTCADGAEETDANRMQEKQRLRSFVREAARITGMKYVADEEKGAPDVLNRYMSVAAPQYNAANLGVRDGLKDKLMWQAWLEKRGHMQSNDAVQPFGYTFRDLDTILAQWINEMATIKLSRNIKDWKSAQDRETFGDFKDCVVLPGKPSENKEKTRTEIVAKKTRLAETSQQLEALKQNPQTRENSKRIREFEETYVATQRLLLGLEQSLRVPCRQFTTEEKNAVTLYAEDFFGDDEKANMSLLLFRQIVEKSPTSAKPDEYPPFIYYYLLNSKPLLWSDLKIAATGTPALRRRSRR